MAGARETIYCRVFGSSRSNVALSSLIQWKTASSWSRMSSMVGGTMRRFTATSSKIEAYQPSQIPSFPASYAHNPSGLSFGSNWMMVIQVAVSAGFFSSSISMETS